MAADGVLVQPQKPRRGLRDLGTLGEQHTLQGSVQSTLVLQIMIKCFPLG
jgi:hypothetical protein